MKLMTECVSFTCKCPLKNRKWRPKTIVLEIFIRKDSLKVREEIKTNSREDKICRLLLVNDS